MKIESMFLSVTKVLNFKSKDIILVNTHYKTISDREQKNCHLRFFLMKYETNKTELTPVFCNNLFILLSGSQ